MTDKLSGLQLKHLEKIQQTLTNMNCKVAIQLPDGEIIGDLNVQVKSTKRNPPKHPHGEVRNYVTKFVNNLKPGMSVMIPFDSYTGKEVQRNVTSYMSANWGNGTYMTALHPEEQTLEVLRIDAI